MYVRMNTGEIREEWDAIGARLIRSGLARRTTEEPEHVKRFADRLTENAGKNVLFLPFISEFGHQIAYHVRLVAHSLAARKVVACRPGDECLYDADEYFTAWENPLPDAQRAGTDRQERHWPEIAARYPGYVPVQAGGLTMAQERLILEPDRKITFRPKRRGLRADVCLGVRHRDLAPARNWRHWQRVADAVTALGLSFATVGRLDTSYHLTGEKYHSGDYDTSAAIELIENSRLWVGSDTGTSHLASTIGAPMIVFRQGEFRSFIQRMERINPGNVHELTDAWDDPQKIIDVMRSRLA